MTWLFVLAVVLLWFYARYRWATRCSECGRPLNWMAENGLGHHFGCADAWWDRNRDEIARNMGVQQSGAVTERAEGST